MAVTLEDVALLFGLPCSGEPMGAVDPPPEPWRDVLLSRFAGVVRRPGAPEVPDFTNSHGPTCGWLRKFGVRFSTYRFFIVLVCNLPLNFEFFQASFMRDDADEQTSNRHLEAYLLWIFGYVMFCGS
jgi:hypothetical protein